MPGYMIVPGIVLIVLGVSMPIGGKLIKFACLVSGLFLVAYVNLS